MYFDKVDVKLMNFKFKTSSWLTSEARARYYTLQVIDATYSLRPSGSSTGMRWNEDFGGKNDLFKVIYANP